MPYIPMAVVSEGETVEEPPVTDYDLWIDPNDSRRVAATGGFASAVVGRDGEAALFQSTDTAQPGFGIRTSPGGRNMLDFDGGTDSMNSSFTLGVRPFSCIGTILPDGFSAVNRFVFSSSATDGLGLFFTTGALLSFNLRDTSASNSAHVISTGVVSVVGYAASTTNVKFVHNDSQSDVANSDAATSSLLVFGSFSPVSNVFDGLLGEWLFWHRELTSQELTDMSGWLQGRWGV